MSFWESDGNLSRASERARGNFLIARQVFDGYRSNLRLFNDGGEVLLGIRAMPLLGHTEGHCGYIIESGLQSLLVWGDIVHFPQIQITRPDVSILFDQDPLQAVETRIKLLDLVSTEQLLIAGMHLGELVFAKIQRIKKSYDIVYEK
ncbi:hypothetical protein SAMN02745753_04259 [Marinomonas polaris DSM 16579]|uniref:Metallo-beta-lactamase superfamily protein n=1 Tax=Marinomonas polaris DSM 16579 TaxID=1122206 RepID=A0A1M5LIM3_9GAMM|nr:hypothetical protein [Marinomonas polaris]SHG64529.1 hypothetical protein SAMN02745753_04259 [Marinomonas polaris DSM 16579]